MRAFSSAKSVDRRRLQCANDNGPVLQSARVHTIIVPSARLPDSLIAFAMASFEIQLNLVAGRRSGSKRSRDRSDSMRLHPETRDLTERPWSFKQPRMTQPRGRRAASTDGSRHRRIVNRRSTSRERYNSFQNIQSTTTAFAFLDRANQPAFAIRRE